MAVDQLANSQIIGVIGLQVAVVIDDGVDRLDSGRRRVQLVDQGDAGFLVGHRHPAAPNSQGTYAGNGGRQVIGGHGFVVVIEAQLFV
ncbi:hypothetical protein D9M71_254840 [compost metagenome]